MEEKILTWFKKVRFQGNSAIVTIPKEIVKTAKLKSQEIYEFTIKVRQGGKIK